MKGEFKVMDLSGIHDYPPAAVDKLEGLNVKIEQGKFTSDEELIASCKNVDALLVTGTYVTLSLLNGLPGLRAIIRYGVGSDRIDLEAAKKQGVIVRNVKGFCVEEISNHVLAIILNFNRHILGTRECIRSYGWSYKGHELYRLTGQNLGIIGMGEIGQVLARKGNSLGMSIFGYDPYIKEIRDINFRLVDIEALLKESDYISIHCPMTNETRHLIGERELMMMKGSSVIINTSRGGIIDENALISALQKGEIAGAGLDVMEVEPPLPDNPLLSMDNVIVTPHVSWYSEEAKKELVILVFEELAKVLHNLSKSC